MLDASASASLDAPLVLPAWAVEAAASAPRISPADAGPLVAIFAEARKACAEATSRFREREAAYDHARHLEFREGFREIFGGTAA